MVDVYERIGFEPPAVPSNDVRVTYTSGARDLPVVPATGGLDFNDVISIVEEIEVVPSVAVSRVVDRVRVEAQPRVIARRKSAREIFEDSKTRFPKIMARLAE